MRETDLAELYRELTNEERGLEKLRNAYAYTHARLPEKALRALAEAATFEPHGSSRRDGLLRFWEHFAKHLVAAGLAALHYAMPSESGLTKRSLFVQHLASDQKVRMGKGGPERGLQDLSLGELFRHLERLFADASASTKDGRPKTWLSSVTVLGGLRDDLERISVGTDASRWFVGLINVVADSSEVERLRHPNAYLEKGIKGRWSSLQKKGLPDFLAALVTFRNAASHDSSGRTNFATAEIRRDPEVSRVLDLALIHATAEVLLESFTTDQPDATESAMHRWDLMKLVRHRDKCLFRESQYLLSNPLGELHPGPTERLADNRPDTLWLVVRSTPQGSPTALAPVPETLEPPGSEEDRREQKVRPKLAEALESAVETLRAKQPFKVGLSLAVEQIFRDSSVTIDPVMLTDMWRNALHKAGLTREHGEYLEPNVEQDNPVVTTTSYAREKGLLSGEHLPLHVNPEAQAMVGRVLANVLLERLEDLGIVLEARGGGATAKAAGIPMEPRQDPVRERAFYVVDEPSVDEPSRNNNAKKLMNVLQQNIMSRFEAVRDDNSHPKSQPEWVVYLARAMGLLTQDDVNALRSAVDDEEDFKLEGPNGPIVLRVKARPRDLIKRLIAPPKEGGLGVNGLQRILDNAATDGLGLQVGRSRYLYRTDGRAEHANRRPFAAKMEVGESLVFELNFAWDFFHSHISDLLSGRHQSPDRAIPEQAHKEDQRLPSSSVHGYAPEIGSVALRLRIGGQEHWAAGPTVGEFLQQLVIRLLEELRLDVGGDEGASKDLHTNAVRVPFKVGRKRYLVSTSPKHNDGSPFRSAVEMEGGLYLEANWSRTYALEVARRLCEAAGCEVLEATDSYGAATVDEGLSTDVEVASGLEVASKE